MNSPKKEIDIAIGKMDKELTMDVRKVLSHPKAFPHIAKALYHLGCAKFECGDFAGAADKFKAAVLLDSENVAIFYEYGRALLANGNTEEALKQFQHAVMRDRNNLDANFKIGVCYQQLGQFDKAINAYNAVISLDASLVEAYNNLGNILVQIGRYKEAVATFQKAISFRPNAAYILANLANVLLKMGRYAEAEEELLKAIKIEPQESSYHYNLGNIYQDQDKFEEAVSAYDDCLMRDTTNAGALHNRGNALRALGRFTEAEDSFRQSIRLDRFYTPAYEGLANVKKHNENDPLFETMRELYEREDISNNKKIDLAFALGKIADDQKDYDSAFTYFATGNRLKRNEISYSMTETDELVRQLQERYSKEYFERIKGYGFPDNMPIFVVGMNRSGTSLVEQILASHSRVEGLGETGEIKILAYTECRSRGKEFPFCIESLNEQDLQRLGKKYIDFLKSKSTGSRYVIDKMPYNFWYLGFIKSILPNSRIIHCRRNPLDTCLSNFQKKFTGEHNYCYNLKELGHYYLSYLDLMNHWNAVLGDSIYQIDYESIINSQSAETEKLLTWLDLEFELPCLEFHQTKRAVKTASFAQVRQPIYKSSVKRWEPYAGYLGEIIKLFDEAGLKY